MTQTPQPTSEQEKILDAFGTGDGLTVIAGAGSGKTTTMRMLAESAPSRRGVYIAYNRAIADDAKASFPAGVTCATAHALAYRAIGRKYRNRLNGPRVPAAQAARILRINEPVIIGEKVLQPTQLARLASETVARFCYSADEVITPRHVPLVKGLEDARRIVGDAVYPLALRTWEDLVQPDGLLRFSHDCYLKLWALSNPVLPYDYVLFDEAQDANPVVMRLVQKQGQAGAQVVAVGDPNQAIYGWRGAIDAMDKFDAAYRLHLSKSFRFGQAVADEANKWLDLLDAELRVEGFERINSVVVDDERAPAAILCRTNGMAVAQVMAAFEQRRRPALVGGGDNIIRLAEAAITLKAGTGTSHPELCAFRTWAEVQDYCEEDSAAGDLKVFVRLVDKHGPDLIIDTMRRLTRDERRADVVISTAHKAKGREWESVRIAADFQPDEENQENEPSREESMLAYVAVTRAKLVLDRRGLAWVDKFTAPRKDASLVAAAH